MAEQTINDNAVHDACQGKSDDFVLDIFEKQQEPNSDDPKEEKEGNSVQEEGSDFTNTWRFVDSVNGGIQGTKIVFLDEENTARTLEGIPSTVKSLYIEFMISKLSSDEDKRDEEDSDEEDKCITIGLATSDKLEFGTYRNTQSLTYVSVMNHGIMDQDGEMIYEDPAILEGNVIGCSIQQVDLNGTRFVTYAFSINGENIGRRRYLKPGKFYPTVWSDTAGLELETNFGENPYQFQLDRQNQMSGSYLLTDVRKVVDVGMEESSPVSKKQIFEVKVPDSATHNVIGLGIQSHDETVKYLWSDGVFVSANDGILHSKEGDVWRCQSGDVIGCSLFLEVFNYENKHFHRLSFSINGSELDRPFWLEGNLPISIGLFRDADCEKNHNEIELNLGERPFEHKIDDTPEEISLLTWPTSKEGDDVQVNGPNIKWSGNKAKRWMKKTTQPIPRQVMAFEFSATIDKMDESTSFGRVKLVAGSKALLYHLSNGEIEYGDKKMATFKGLTLEDTVRFSLRRLLIGADTFNLCQIQVNEDKYCSEVVIEGVDVYPAVDIKSSGAELNTAFSIGNAHGKEGENETFYQPERLQKIPFLADDETEVTFKMEGNDEAESSRNVGKFHYMEVSLEKGTSMAIQLESESGKIIYHNRTSSVLEQNDFIVTKVKPLQKSDVLGLVVAFLDEEKIENSKDGDDKPSMSKIRTKHYAACQFLHNGRAVGKGFRLEGKTVKPTIFRDAKSTTVNSSLIAGELEKKKGTCCGTCWKWVGKCGTCCIDSVRCCCRKQKETSEEKEDEEYTKIQLLCLMLWRFLGILTLPYFWYKDRFCYSNGKPGYWNPKNPKFVLTNYMLSVVLPFWDCFTDFKTGANYLKPKKDGKAKHPWYGRITVGVPFLPFLVKSAIESIKIGKFALSHLNLFLKLKRTIVITILKDVASHLPFLQQIRNVDTIVTLSSLTESEAQTIVLKLGSRSNWEPFLESFPQLVVQFYIVTQLSLTDELDPIVVVSMATSSISIAMAGAAAYQLERLGHPVASHITGKLFLAGLFIMVTVPRAILIGLLPEIFKKISEFSWHYLLIMFLMSMVLLMIISMRLGARIWPRELPPVKKFSQEKGEYEQENQKGLQGIITELDWKASVLSFFMPSILISENFMVFEITALVSSLVHFIISITGLIMCHTGDWDEHIAMWFLVNTVLLVPSGLALVMIGRLKDQTYLRKCMFGKFSHPSLISIFVEKVKNQDFERQTKVKKQNSKDLQLEIKKLDQQTRKEHEENLQEFDQLCKEIADLEGPILISRTQTTVITKTPMQLVKELRRCDEFMGVLIANIYIKRLKNGNNLHKNDDVSQSQEKTVYNDDVNIIYLNINNGHIAIDSVDEQGKTALCLAAEKNNADGVELLLYHGASVMQENRDKKTAIEVAVDTGNDHITKMIWEKVKGEEGRNQLFYQLCGQGDKKSIEFILKNSNKKEKQEMIECNSNENKRNWFPLLKTVYEGHDEVSAILIKEHIAINKDHLIKVDEFGRNCLMWAAYLIRRKETVQMLLKHLPKNQLYHTDNNGSTAVDWARKGQHREIAEIIQSHID